MRPDKVEEGQLWTNEFGMAEVLAVRGQHAMMQRKRNNPFVISTKRLLDPAGGWDMVGIAERKRYAD